MSSRVRRLYARAAARLDHFILRVHSIEETRLVLKGESRCATCSRPWPCPPSAAALARLEATEHLR